MPARRELHTGRYNFLHAPWGYLEPFDDSVPQILSRAGIHTHLVSDHYHYWENAGGNYHCHYRTWDAVRGQEGDPWIALTGGLDTPRRNQRQLSPNLDLAEQDAINRTLWNDNEEMRPMHRTFSKGLEFLDVNHAQDNWYLTIETFDPHEPFDAPARLKAEYPDSYEGPLFDWDNYGPVTETPEEIAHLRACYQALVSYCDEQLGRVLAAMDRYQLWEDTLLIVCTDHGHFLSERGFWAKNYMPVYNELAHIPLFIWDPRSKQRGVQRQSLVQSIDIPATLLDYFGITRPSAMQGRSLAPVLRDDAPVRGSGLFGYFGQMTCLIDGDWVFMRAPKTPDNGPLNRYTWMLHDAGGVDVEGDFDFAVYPFSKGLPVPKIPVLAKPLNQYQQEDLLFNLRDDPGQQHPVQDEAMQQRMRARMALLMKESDAPPEQFTRLGLAMPD
jgi:arylsulfatase A-like enzyme